MIPAPPLNLISFNPTTQDVLDDGRFRLTWGSSLILHFLVLGLVLNLRFASTVERPIASYQVSLVSLPDVMPAPSAKKAEAQKAADADTPAPVKMKTNDREAKEVSPSSPVSKEASSSTKEPPPSDPGPAPVEIPQAPPLSEALSGELNNIVVPKQQRPLPVPQSPQAQDPTVHKTDTALKKMADSIIPPPQIPKMKVVPPRPVGKMPQHPSPKSLDIKKTIQKTVKSVVVPQPKVKTSKISSGKPVLPVVPKAPKLASVKPLPKATRRVPAPSKMTEPITPLNKAVKVPNNISTPRTPAELSKPTKPKPPLKIKKSQPRFSKAAPKTEQLTDSLRKTLKSIELPKPRPRQAFQPSTPTLQPSTPPPRKKLASTLREALDKIEVPKPKKNPVLFSSKPIPEVKNAPKPSMLKDRQDSMPPIMLPHDPPQLQKIPKVQKPWTAPATRREEESNQIRAALKQSKEQLDRLQIPSGTLSQASDPISSQGANGKQVSDTPDLQMVGGMPNGNPYWGRVKANIVRHWVAPKVDVRQHGPLQVIVAFRIDRTGNISHVKIQKPSGNAYYDIAAKRAVLAANPLPHFPSDMPDRYHNLMFQFSVVHLN